MYYVFWICVNIKVYSEKFYTLLILTENWWQTMMTHFYRISRNNLDDIMIVMIL